VEQEIGGLQRAFVLHFSLVVLISLEFLSLSSRGGLVNRQTFLLSVLQHFRILNFSVLETLIDTLGETSRFGFTNGLVDFLLEDKKDVRGLKGEA
jgi:hypothetical protein